MSENKLIWQGVVSELKCAPTCRVVQTHYNPPRVLVEIATNTAALGEPVWRKADIAQRDITLSNAIVELTTPLCFKKDVNEN